MNVVWIHLTATMSKLAPALCREDTGSWLWGRLRRAFPDAIAATLMPDHLHLLVASRNRRAAEQRLARLIGQFGRRFGVEGSALRRVGSEPIRPGKVLARQVRYIALDPCRAGLVRCPLAWPWSTRRDVVGAVADPWVTAPRLAAALGSSPRDFAARHHAYVSSDPDARVDGTPFPVAAKAILMPTMPLRAIAQAVSATMRRPIEDIRQRGPVRALFVALAFEQGWDHPAKLAEICRCEVRSIRSLATSVDDATLRPARVCLGDERLRGSLAAKCSTKPFRGDRDAR